MFRALQCGRLIKVSANPSAGRLELIFEVSTSQGERLFVGLPDRSRLRPIRRPAGGRHRRQRGKA